MRDHLAAYYALNARRARARSSRFPDCQFQVSTMSRRCCSACLLGDHRVLAHLHAKHTESWKTILLASCSLWHRSNGAASGTQPSCLQGAVSSAHAFMRHPCMPCAWSIAPAHSLKCSLGLQKSQHAVATGSARMHAAHITLSASSTTRPVHPAPCWAHGQADTPRSCADRSPRQPAVHLVWQEEWGRRAAGALRAAAAQPPRGGHASTARRWRRQAGGRPRR
jgi:hypothetical protein